MPQYVIPDLKAHEKDKETRQKLTTQQVVDFLTAINNKMAKDSWEKLDKDWKFGVDKKGFPSIQSKTLKVQIKEGGGLYISDKTGLIGRWKNNPNRDINSLHNLLSLEAAKVIAQGFESLDISKKTSSKVKRSSEF